MMMLNKRTLVRRREVVEDVCGRCLYDSLFRVVRVACVCVARVCRQPQKQMTDALAELLEDDSGIAEFSSW